MNKRKERMLELRKSIFLENKDMEEKCKDINTAAKNNLTFDDALNMYKNEMAKYSVGEELLTGVSDLEERCNVIRMAVEGKYFSLKEALILYKVSMEDYEKQK